MWVWSRGSDAVIDIVVMGGADLKAISADFKGPAADETHIILYHVSRTSNALLAIRS